MRGVGDRRGTPSDLLVVGLDAAPRELAVDHSAQQGIQPGHQVAIDRRRGVRIADPAVVGQEGVAALGQCRHRPHCVFGLVGHARGGDGHDLDAIGPQVPGGEPAGAEILVVRRRVGDQHHQARRAERVRDRVPLVLAESRRV